jgi:hypothetical protein
MAQMDETEETRRILVDTINDAPGSREALTAEYGQVWDTEDVRREFDVLGFLAPFIVVRRKADGAQGSLMFQHEPRFYFRWAAD